MEVNDCLYDDLSLLQTTAQNEYDNNMLDDIMNSSETHIDTSLDLNELLHDVKNDQVFSELYHSNHINDLNYCVDSISPLSELPYLKQSQRNSKPLSFVDETENVDDLISYLNYNTINQLECDSNGLYTHNRNTPSPTGSCSSSSGSSTSGVQSDISDVSQNKPLGQAVAESAKVGLCIKSGDDRHFNTNFSINFPNISDTDQLKPQTSTELKSFTSQNSQNRPSVFSFKPVINKSCPNPQIPNYSATSSKTIDATLKPKTIVLSSRDYRALMQKIHPNEAKPFPKINGTIGSNIPKIVLKKSNTERLKKESNSDFHIKEQEKSALFSNHMSKQTNGSPKFEFLKSLTADEKMYKKQQRMIKNRESAYLSRKKRKEYVVSLETRINKLEQENYVLKGDNIQLRNQLIAFEKHCTHQTGKTNEIVLHSLVSDSRSEKHHVRIAPKPKCSYQKLPNATVKKNVALLFAMAFMVTMNAGNFQSYFKKPNIQDDGNILEASLKDSSLIGRRLLWVESEGKYNETSISNSNISDQTVVPPLYFLNSPGRTKIYKKVTTMSPNYTHNEPPPLAYPSKCIGCCNTSNFNLQSEYFKLTQHLNKWANGNLTTSSGFTSEKDNPHGFKLPNEYLDLKTEMHSKHQGKRKMYLNLNDFSSDIQGKRRKTDKKINKTMFNKSEQINLINGINRKEDTFYAISFNMDHILLPPSKLNNSARPKMSLLFPKGNQGHNGEFKFMQVDCEVFNTKELDLKSSIIPVGVRPNNIKWKSNTQKDQNEDFNPIFDKDTIMINDKPQVRTFYMVGPKNQAAASASHEKTRLVQFNQTMITNSSQIPIPRWNARNRGSLHSHLKP